MRNIVGTLRNEVYLTTLEENIEEDLDVRVYDEIIESLNIEKIGYKDKVRKTNAGRPSYSVKCMLKIYVYGYRNGIRSGKKLENACKYDTRFQWLTNKEMPDANTINDFRKNNKEFLKKSFYEINRMFVQMGLMSIKEVSQDGFKIRANNSKERNYTINKITDRIKRENKAIEEATKKFEDYLKDLEKSEELEKIEEEIKAKKEELEEIIEKKEKHEKLLKEMQRKGISQISLTDKESRLMKNNGKFEVSYNVQTLVDMKSHMTTTIEVDNNPSDIGSMSTIGEKLKKEYGEEEIVSNTTDKGYNSTIDMAECLEIGIIPQVTPMKKESKEVEIEVEYEETEVSKEEIESKKGKDIKKCLRSGKIPECYKEVIREIKVEEKEETIETKEEVTETRSSEEIREEAIEKQTFERDIRTGIVYCPSGEMLSKKSKNGKDRIRYANKLACKRCKNPCTQSKYKTVDFITNQKTVCPKNSSAEKPRKVKKAKKRKKVVKIKLILKEELLKKRMQTSEHSQGTMKTADNHSYFNVRGKEAVEADVAIHFMASNIRRACNMVKVQELIEEVRKIRKKEECKEGKVFQIVENFFLTWGGNIVY